MRSAVAAVVLAVEAAGLACGHDVSARCRADAESDLTKEPAFAAPGFQRWTNAKGCAVRRDYLNTHAGPEHCDLQSVTSLVMGDPVGMRFGKSLPHVRFVRDPERRLRAVAPPLDTNAVLPPDARDTGYRQDGTKLWMRPNDSAFAYLMVGKRVERWPRGDYTCI